VPGGAYDGVTVGGSAFVEFLADVTSSAIQIAGSPTFDGSLQLPGVTSLSVSNGTTTLKRPWAVSQAIDLALTNATLSVSGTSPLLLNSLTLSSSSLTHAAATSSTSSLLDLQVSGAVTIDSSSRIDVSGKGYLGGLSGDNSSSHGRTQGNVPTAATQFAGGSYGGYGYANGATPVPVYGDMKNPTDLGTGGDAVNTTSPGGSGGGFIRLTGASLVLNGSLNADGGNGTRGGSGGSIRVSVTGALSGTGTIHANGGSNWGGGGRIAVYYGSLSGFALTQAKASGAFAGAGTVFSQSSLEANGELRLDDIGGSPAGLPATPVPGVGGTLTLDALSVTNSAHGFSPDTLVCPNINVDTTSTFDTPTQHFP